MGLKEQLKKLESDRDFLILKLKLRLSDNDLKPISGLANEIDQLSIKIANKTQDLKIENLINMSEKEFDEFIDTLNIIVKFDKNKHDELLRAEYFNYGTEVLIGFGGGYIGYFKLKPSKDSLGFDISDNTLYSIDEFKKLVKSNENVKNSLINMVSEWYLKIQ